MENADDTIYMYYDNPSAASASDANATFVRVIENVRGSWSLDENAGTTAADNSGYGNDGTISGATWTAGKFGSAENFDGAGDNINVGNDNSLLVTPVSVEAWIKPATGGIPTGRRWTIASKFSTTANWGWLLDLADDAGVEGYRFWVRGTSAKWSTTISTAWTHIVGTYDGLNIRLYVDNVLRASATAGSPGNIADTGNVIIGSRNPVSGQVQENFKGVIDEVKIYKDNLTPEKISDLYNNYGYVTPNYPGKVLVREWVSPEPAASIGDEETC